MEHPPTVTPDYTINNDTKEVFASVTVVASLCGATEGAVQIFATAMHWNIDAGLTPEMLQATNAHFAIIMQYPQAIQTLVVLATAGAKVIIQAEVDAV